MLRALMRRSSFSAAPDGRNESGSNGKKSSGFRRKKTDSKSKAALRGDDRNRGLGDVSADPPSSLPGCRSYDPSVAEEESVAEVDRDTRGARRRDRERSSSPEPVPRRSTGDQAQSLDEDANEKSSRWRGPQRWPPGDVSLPPLDTGVAPTTSDHFAAEIASPGFSQFPMQYDNNINYDTPNYDNPASNPPPLMPDSSPTSPAMYDPHAPQQFPGQFPAYSTEPYRPSNPAGEAADYYGDQGQSVHNQPGVRPNPPLVIPNSQAHLMPASPVANPPPEPSSVGQVGSAADYYADSPDLGNPAPPQQSPLRPPIPSKPIKPSAVLNGVPSGPLTYGSPDSSTSSSVPPDVPGPGSAGPQPAGFSQDSPANTHSMGPAIGAAAATAAAGYMANHHNHSSTSSSEHPLPSPYPTQNYEPYSPNGLGQPGPAIYPNPTLNDQAYAAHPSHPEHQAVYHSSLFQSGSLAFQQRQRGPLDKFIDFWKDPEGVGEYEDYTESIGVCRYCFEPGTTSHDAPRKHNYRPRRRSSDRFSNDSRVDKSSRYSSSSDDESRRRRSSSKKSWLGGLLSGYAVKSLFESPDFEDSYNVRPSRVSSPHASSSDSECDSDGEGKPSRRYRRSSRSQSPGGSRRNSYLDPRRSRYEGHRLRSRSRSGSDSRSRSSSRHSALRDFALGAAVGTAASAAASQPQKKRSRSPKKKGKSRKDPATESSSSSYLDISRPSTAGGLGSFFSSSSENKKKQPRPISRKSIFPFSNNNSSSSSLDNDLAFGTAYAKKPKKSKKRKGKKKDEDVDAKLLELSAAAMALAGSAHGRRRPGEILAGKDSRSRRPQSAPSAPKDEEWEDFDSEGQSSSVSSALAFGGSSQYGGSEDSSDSSTPKWNWRWGSKKDKKKNEPKQDSSSHGDFPTGPTLAGTAALGTAALASGYRKDGRHSSSPSSSSAESLQQLDPIPASEPPRLNVANFTSSSVQQPAFVRPRAIPLQQPQPVTPVSQAVYSSQGEPAPVYNAPTVPPFFPPAYFDPAFQSQRRGRGDEVYPEVNSTWNRSHRRRESSPDFYPGPFQDSTTSSSRRRVADQASVQFDLTEEQKDKERRAARREEREKRDSDHDHDIRVLDHESEEKENERREPRCLERLELEPERGRSRSRSRSSSRRDRSLDRRRRENANSSSWVGPAAAGAAAAAAAMSSVVPSENASESSQRHNERSAKRRAERRRPSSEVGWDQGSVGPARADVEDKPQPRPEPTRVEPEVKPQTRAEPAPVNVEGKLQTTPEDQPRPSKIATSSMPRTKPTYENYAAYFAPEEIRHSPDAQTEHREDGATPEGPEPPSQRYDEHPSQRYDALPWPVPQLNLIEPTPPHSKNGSVRDVASPEPATAEPSQKEEAPRHDQGSTTGSRVSFGGHQTYEYEAPSTSSEQDSVNYEIAQEPDDTQRGPTEEDIEFAATLAAGAEIAGFDPAMVTDNPYYHSRSSPPQSEHREFSEPEPSWQKPALYSFEPHGVAEAEVETPPREEPQAEEYASEVKRHQSRAREAIERFRQKDQSFDAPKAKETMPGSFEPEPMKPVQEPPSRPVIEERRPRDNDKPPRRHSSRGNARDDPRKTALELSRPEPISEEPRSKEEREPVSNDVSSKENHEARISEEFAPMTLASFPPGPIPEESRSKGEQERVKNETPLEDHNTRVPEEFAPIALASFPPRPISEEPWSKDERGLVKNDVPSKEDHNARIPGEFAPMKLASFPPGPIPEEPRGKGEQEQVKNETPLEDDRQSRVPKETPPVCPPSPGSMYRMSQDELSRSEFVLEDNRKSAPRQNIPEVSRSVPISQDELNPVGHDASLEDSRKHEASSETEPPVCPPSPGSMYRLSKDDLSKSELVFGDIPRVPSPGSMYRMSQEELSRSEFVLENRRPVSPRPKGTAVSRLPLRLGRRSQEKLDSRKDDVAFPGKDPKDSAPAVSIPEPVGQRRRGQDKSHRINGNDKANISSPSNDSLFTHPTPQQAHEVNSHSTRVPGSDTSSFRGRSQPTSQQQQQHPRQSGTSPKQVFKEQLPEVTPPEPASEEYWGKDEQDSRDIDPEDDRKAKGGKDTAPASRPLIWNEPRSEEGAATKDDVPLEDNSQTKTTEETLADSVPAPNGEDRRRKDEPDSKNDDVVDINRGVKDEEDLNVQRYSFSRRQREERRRHAAEGIVGPNGQTREEYEKDRKDAEEHEPARSPETPVKVDDGKDNIDDSSRPFSLNVLDSRIRSRSISPPGSAKAIVDVSPKSRSRPTSPELNQQRESLQANDGERSRRLSMLQLSPTAIPLQFRRPPSTPLTGRRSPSVGSPEPPALSLGSPPEKRARRTSTEFVNSREFRPLYLVEQHGSGRTEGQQPVDELLPSLPSSKSSSQSSSLVEDRSASVYPDEKGWEVVEPIEDAQPEEQPKSELSVSIPSQEPALQREDEPKPGSPITVPSQEPAGDHELEKKKEGREKDISREAEVSESIDEQLSPLPSSRGSLNGSVEDLSAVPDEQNWKIIDPIQGVQPEEQLELGLSSQKSVGDEGTEKAKAPEQIDEQLPPLPSSKGSSLNASNEDLGAVPDEDGLHPVDLTVQPEEQSERDLSTSQGPVSTQDAQPDNAHQPDFSITNPFQEPALSQAEQQPQPDLSITIPSQEHAVYQDDQPQDDPQLNLPITIPPQGPSDDDKLEKEQGKEKEKEKDISESQNEAPTEETIDKDHTPPGMREKHENDWEVVNPIQNALPEEQREPGFSVTIPSQQPTPNQDAQSDLSVTTPQEAAGEEESEKEKGKEKAVDFSDTQPTEEAIDESPPDTWRGRHEEDKVVNRTQNVQPQAHRKPSLSIAIPSQEPAGEIELEEEYAKIRERHTPEFHEFDTIDDEFTASEIMREREKHKHEFDFHSPAELLWDPHKYFITRQPLGGMGSRSLGGRLAPTTNDPPKLEEYDLDFSDPDEENISPPESRPSSPPGEKIPASEPELTAPTQGKRSENSEGPDFASIDDAASAPAVDVRESEQPTENAPETQQVDFEDKAAIPEIETTPPVNPPTPTQGEKSDTSMGPGFAEVVDATVAAAVEGENERPKKYVPETQQVDLKDDKSIVSDVATPPLKDETLPTIPDALVPVTAPTEENQPSSAPGFGQVVDAAVAGAAEENKQLKENALKDLDTDVSEDRSAVPEIEITPAVAVKDETVPTVPDVPVPVIASKEQEQTQSSSPSEFAAIVDAASAVVTGSTDDKVAVPDQGMARDLPVKSKLDLNVEAQSEKDILTIEGPASETDPIDEIQSPEDEQQPYRALSPIMEEPDLESEKQSEDLAHYEQTAAPQEREKAEPEVEQGQVSEQERGVEPGSGAQTPSTPSTVVEDTSVSEHKRAPVVEQPPVPEVELTAAPETEHVPESTLKDVKRSNEASKELPQPDDEVQSETTKTAVSRDDYPESTQDSATEFHDAVESISKPGTDAEGSIASSFERAIDTSEPVSPHETSSEAGSLRLAPREGAFLPYWGIGTRELEPEVPAQDVQVNPAEDVSRSVPVENKPEERPLEQAESVQTPIEAEEATVKPESPRVELPQQTGDSSALEPSTPTETVEPPAAEAEPAVTGDEQIQDQAPEQIQQPNPEKPEQPALEVFPKHAVDDTTAETPAMAIEKFPQAKPAEQKEKDRKFVSSLESLTETEAEHSQSGDDAAGVGETFETSGEVSVTIDARHHPSAEPAGVKDVKQVSAAGESESITPVEKSEPAPAPLSEPGTTPVSKQGVEAGGERSKHGFPSTTLDEAASVELPPSPHAGVADMNVPAVTSDTLLSSVTPTEEPSQEQPIEKEMPHNVADNQSPADVDVPLTPAQKKKAKKERRKKRHSASLDESVPATPQDESAPIGDIVLAETPVMHEVESEHGLSKNVPAGVEHTEAPKPSLEQEPRKNDVSLDPGTTSADGPVAEAEPIQEKAQDDIAPTVETSGTTGESTVTLSKPDEEQERDVATIMEPAIATSSDHSDEALKEDLVVGTDVNAPVEHPTATEPSSAKDVPEDHLADAAHVPNQPQTHATVTENVQEQPGLEQDNVSQTVPEEAPVIESSSPTVSKKNKKKKHRRSASLEVEQPAPIENGTDARFTELPFEARIAPEQAPAASVGATEEKPVETPVAETQEEPRSAMSKKQAKKERKKRRSMIFNMGQTPDEPPVEPVQPSAVDEAPAQEVKQQQDDDTSVKPSQTVPDHDSAEEFEIIDGPSDTPIESITPELQEQAKSEGLREVPSEEAPKGDEAIGQEAPQTEQKEELKPDLDAQPAAVETQSEVDTSQPEATELTKSNEPETKEPEPPTSEPKRAELLESTSETTEVKEAEESAQQPGQQDTEDTSSMSAKAKKRAKRERRSKILDTLAETEAERARQAQQGSTEGRLTGTLPVTEPTPAEDSDMWTDHLISSQVEQRQGIPSAFPSRLVSEQVDDNQAVGAVNERPPAEPAQSSPEELEPAVGVSKDAASHAGPDSPVQPEVEIKQERQVLSMAADEPAPAPSGEEVEPVPETEPWTAGIETQDESKDESAPAKPQNEEARQGTEELPSTRAETNERSQDMIESTPADEPAAAADAGEALEKSISDVVPPNETHEQPSGKQEESAQIQGMGLADNLPMTQTNEEAVPATPSRKRSRKEKKRARKRAKEDHEGPASPASVDDIFPAESPTALIEQSPAMSEQVEQVEDTEPAVPQDAQLPTALPQGDEQEVVAEEQNEEPEVKAENLSDSAKEPGSSKRTAKETVEQPHQREMEARTEPMEEKPIPQPMKDEQPPTQEKGKEAQEEQVDSSVPEPKQVPGNNENIERSVDTGSEPQASIPDGKQGNETPATDEKPKEESSTTPPLLNRMAKIFPELKWGTLRLASKNQSAKDRAEDETTDPEVSRGFENENATRVSEAPITSPNQVQESQRERLSFTEPFDDEPSFQLSTTTEPETTITDVAIDVEVDEICKVSILSDEATGASPAIAINTNLADGAESSEQSPNNERSAHDPLSSDEQSSTVVDSSPTRAVISREVSPSRDLRRSPRLYDPVTQPAKTPSPTRSLAPSSPISEPRDFVEKTDGARTTDSNGKPRLEIKPVDSLQPRIPRSTSPLRRFTNNAWARPNEENGENKPFNPPVRQNSLPIARMPRTPEQRKSILRPSSMSNFHGMPKMQQIPHSPELPRSLRRRSKTTRDMSGDLRATSQALQDVDGSQPPPTDTNIERIASSSSYDPVTDKGKRPIRGMTNVYEAWGETPSSPRSPSRPPSVRHRRSMQQLQELESRLDRLVSENRLLNAARDAAEDRLQKTSIARRKSDQALNSQNTDLRDRQEEVEDLKNSVEWLQKEVNRLTGENEGLTSTGASLAAAHAQEIQEIRESSAREIEELRAQYQRATADTQDRIRREVDMVLAQKNIDLRRLREELESARDKVKRLQQQLAASARDDVVVFRDEDFFEAACHKLCGHVQQWVLRFSKHSDHRRCLRLSDLEDDKLVDQFDNAILDGSDVESYLADRVRRRDVFMSIVMTMVWEFIFARYMFGMDREQRQKLKILEKQLTEAGTRTAVHRWRATTLSLLSKRPSFAKQREIETTAVAAEILKTISSILPPPTQVENQLLDSLCKVLRVAVTLSVEMRSQLAEYIMLPPLQPEYDANGVLARYVHFNAALMNERSDLNWSNEDLQAHQAPVRMVLFPLVVKKGDDRGEGEEEVAVYPAQVLVTRPSIDRHISRVVNGDRMSLDRQPSVHSTAPSSNMDNSFF